MSLFKGMWGVGGTHLSTCLLAKYVVMCHYSSYLVTKIPTGCVGNHMYRKGGNMDTVAIPFVLESFVKNLFPSIQLFIIVTFDTLISKVNYICTTHTKSSHCDIILYVGHS